MDFAPEFGDYPAAFPRIARFLAAMRGRPAFQATMPKEPEYAKAA
jgi:glutathione S-transferase